MLFPKQQQGAINVFSSRGTSGMTLLPAVALRHLGCCSLSSCGQHLNLNYRWNEALFIKLGLFWGVQHDQRNKEKQGCELKKVETLQQADGTVLHYAN